MPQQQEEYLIHLRVSKFEFNKFKQLKEEHNLSAREVLAYSGCPCDKCKCLPIIAFDKHNGEPFEIPRGIISRKNNY